MTTSLYIALGALFIGLLLLASGLDSTGADVILFILGVIVISGLGFNAVIWILSGYGLPLRLKPRTEDEERKAIMVFNKINAPGQNRRDTLVILSGALVVGGLSAALFYYLF